MRHSWVEVPVVVQASGRPALCVQGHVTVKYLGRHEAKALSNVESNTRRTMRFFERTPIDFTGCQLVQTIFEHKSEKFHVLEIVNPPARLLELRALLDPLRNDDFPTYRPHVTIKDVDVWASLNSAHIVESKVHKLRRSKV